MANLYTKCKNIKIVITDVDGVLTDGGMYYTDEGDTMKKFHVRDGMGVTLLRRQNIPTIIVTKEKTRIVKQWANSMKIATLYDGVVKKESMLEKICAKFNVKPNQIAYIGDDVNDLELLKKVGLSAVPNDAISESKKICHYVCNTKAGQGAFRELADLILHSQKKH
ncbi:MAG: HAD-IIIA family hydrolase [Nitrosopumilaceae archaeon]